MLRSNVMKGLEVSGRQTVESITFGVRQGMRHDGSHIIRPAPWGVCVVKAADGWEVFPLRTPTDVRKLQLKKALMRHEGAQLRQLVPPCVSPKQHGGWWEFGWRACGAVALEEALTQRVICIETDSPLETVRGRWYWGTRK